MIKALLPIAVVFWVNLALAMVNEYTFSQSTQTYTEITGGTVVATGNIDDMEYLVPLPFPFTFNQTSVTVMAMSSKGNLSFDAGDNQFYYPAISTSIAGTGVAAPLSMDLQGRADGEMRYEVFGTSPNQIAIYQWKNWRGYESANVNDNWNFQVILYQTTNNLAFRYGDFSWQSSYAGTAQVGLRGTDNTDFNNRTTTTNWSATAAGTLNTANCTISSTVFPPNGLQFLYAPPRSVNMTNGSVTLNPGDSYDFYDSGGPSHYYHDLEDYTFTFHAPTNHAIRSTFSVFDCEYGFDFLYIHDGPTTDDPLLGTYTGFTLPPQCISSHDSGALTFHFTSDYNVPYPGWAAVIDLITLTAPPNPAVAVFPLDGTAMVSNTASLTWNSGGGSPTGYTLYFGTTTPPPLIGNLGNLNSWTPLAMSANTTHYWRVVPYNSHGDATGCPVWSFTTAPAGLLQIGNGTDVSPYLPIAPFVSYSYSQCIYLRSEIGAPATITSVSWYWNGAYASNRSTNWTVYLGQTTNDEFSSTTDWLPYADLTQVFTGTVALPAIPGWITVTLATPYVYDASGNLVIAVDENYPANDAQFGLFHCSAAPNARGLLYTSNGDNPDPVVPPTPALMQSAFANVRLAVVPWSSGPPNPPVLDYPPAGATGLPLGGFGLQWHPDLSGGTGVPDYYMVYMSQSETSIYEDQAWPSTSNHFNPVSDGGLTFDYLDEWFWTVKAVVIGEGYAVADPPRCFTVVGPPQIAVAPGSITQTLEMGETATQQLSITNNGGLPLNFNIGLSDTGIPRSLNAPWDQQQLTGNRDPVAWVTAAPLTGTVAPNGGTLLVDIDFDSNEAGPGNFIAFISITHNAPSTPPVEVPILLTVTGIWPPVFAIDPSTWNYGDVEQMNPVTRQFTITNTGGGVPAPLNINPGDIYMGGDAEGNFTIEAPGLPVSLSHNQTYSFDVTFTPQTAGAKSGILNIADNSSRLIHSVSLSGNGTAEPIGQIINLRGEVQNDTDVMLTWGLYNGIPGSPGWIHYDDGVNVDGIGAGSEFSFDVAAKFESTTLYAYAGMQLTHIKFFPRSALSTYVLKIWTGMDASLGPDTEVYSQAVTGQTAMAWNDITLTTAFPITGSQAVWIGYQVDCPAYSDDFFPAGCDGGPAINGYGNLIGFEGNWYALTDINEEFNCNWNLQGYVDNAATRGDAPLLSIPVIGNPRRDFLRKYKLASSSGTTFSRVLRGFNVFRDGTQINSTLVSANSYLDVNLAPGIYSYTVQGVYYSANTGLSSPASVMIVPPNLLPLPLNETWASGYLDTNLWSPGSDNWSMAHLIGIPAPAVAFVWMPQVLDYSIPLTSHWLDGTAATQVMLSYDLMLDNYGASLNSIITQVFDGSAWNTVLTHDNVAGDIPWTNYNCNITPYAAGKFFRIRFLAAGVDSWDIDYWYIDNINVTAVAGLQQPVVTITKDPAGVHLEWAPVIGANSYQIFRSPDPQTVNWGLPVAVTGGTSWIDSVPPASGFYRVTASSEDRED